LALLHQEADHVNTTLGHTVGEIERLVRATIIQRRANAPVRAAKAREEAAAKATREAEKPEDSDFIKHLFTASTHDYLMFFTNLGRVYVERVHEIPDLPRTSKGRSIANLLELRAGESIQALVRIVAKYGSNKEDLTWQQTNELFFVTRQGTCKRTALSDFQNVRKGGIIAITLEQGDDLIEVRLTSGKDEIVLITREGMSIRFPEEDVRSMGRSAAGVIGIEHRNTQCLQSRGAGLRAADRAFDLVFHAGQRVDELVDGGACADADPLARHHIGQRCATDQAFEFISGE